MCVKSERAKFNLYLKKKTNLLQLLIHVKVDLCVFVSHAIQTQKNYPSLSLDRSLDISRHRVSNFIRSNFVAFAFFVRFQTFWFSYMPRRKKSFETLNLKHSNTFCFNVTVTVDQGVNFTWSVITLVKRDNFTTSWFWMG